MDFLREPAFGFVGVSGFGLFWFLLFLFFGYFLSLSLTPILFFTILSVLTWGFTCPYFLASWGGCSLRDDKSSATCRLSAPCLPEDRPNNLFAGCLRLGQQNVATASSLKKQPWLPDTAATHIRSQ